MTTIAGGDIYQTNSKQILVTRDPIYIHPAVKNGRYVGRKPHDYLPLAIGVTILNPLFGFLAIIFSVMSRRSYKDGDLTYATKWSQYAFLTGVITIIASVVIYIAIGFAIAGPNLRGGHTM